MYTHIQCIRCKLEMPLSGFHRNKDSRSKRSYRSTCKECQKLEQKTSYAKNREAKIASVLKRRDVLKRKVFAILGDECNRCGEDDHIVLEIDHVNGDGYLEGKNRGGQAIYAKILASPERFQLLCANCHTRKTKYDARKKSNP